MKLHRTILHVSIVTCNACHSNSTCIFLHVEYEINNFDLLEGNIDILYEMQTAFLFALTQHYPIDSGKFFI